MKLEKLAEVLDYAVGQGYIKDLTNEDIRNFTFTVVLTGAKYKVQWWVNICYLTTECGTYIPFHRFTLSSTWPNNFKMSIQLEYNKDKCAIIGVEEYTSNETTSN